MKYLIYCFILISLLPLFLIFQNFITLESTIGSLTGLIGGVLLFWEFLLSSRYVIRYFNLDFFKINKIHKDIGTYGLLIVFIHPILELLNYLEKFKWIFYLDFSNETEILISLGRIAFWLFLIIYISSALLMGKIKYRPWLYLHYLSYPMFGLTFFHALLMGNNIEKYLVIKVYFVILGLIYIILILHRLYKSSTLGLSKLKILEITRKSNIVIITIPFKNKVKMGQYFYLQLNKFGESHPFTVYKINPTTIEFAIKSVGKFSNQIFNLNEGNFIYLDGPFGKFLDESDINHYNAIFAGGIGITPFLELIKSNPNKSILFNSNKKFEDIIDRQLFISILGNRYFDFLSQDNTKDFHILNEKINLDNVHNILTMPIDRFYICGSKRYISGVKSILNELGVEKNKIHIEDFG